MKQTFKSTVKSLLALTTVAILGVSCQKEVAAPQEGTRDAAVSALMSQAAPAPGMKTIAELAIASPEYSELVEALLYVDEAPLNAGLVAALSGTDQFTVFAPTNDAFDDLYEKLSTQQAPIDDIRDLPQGLVAAVLKYHVTEGRRAANSVIPRNGMRTIETLLTGSTFSVNSSALITAAGTIAGVGTNTAQINPAKANISASNGIIHEIGAVILP